MRTLNIIGCGKLGKALGKLWVRHGLVQIGDVANRSLQSSERAVAFLGQGRAVADVRDMRPADIHLVGTSDDNIGKVAEQLAGCSIVSRNDTVFHCSGALSSTVLTPLRPLGAVLGSVHPVKSFADPKDAFATFAGTFCAVEGEPQAQAVLRELFTGIGAKVFSIDSENKLLYHAATGFACSYLTAILELSSRCFLKAGIDAKTSMQLMEPLVLETVANVFKLGPAQALTGPISRGDSGLVASQLAALSEWQPETGNIYRLLGKVALQLSRERGAAGEIALKHIEDILKTR